MSDNYKAISNIMNAMKDLTSKLVNDIHRTDLMPENLREKSEIQRDLSAAERELAFEQSRHEASNRQLDLQYRASNREIYDQMLQPLRDKVSRLRDELIVREWYDTAPIEELEKKAEEKRAERWKEKQKANEIKYKELLLRYNSVSSARDLRVLAEELRALDGHKEAKALAKKCQEKADQIAEDYRERIAAQYERLKIEKRVVLNSDTLRDIFNLCHEMGDKSLAEKYCHVSIPDSITKIDDGAFESSPYLKSITIHGNVVSIGKGAFKDCSSLSQVIISDGTIFIGDEAFYGCPEIKSITIPGSVESIGDHAFTCESDKGDTLSRISSFYSLKRDSKLSSLTIADGVKNIGKSAFRNCTELTSLAIPGSVNSIGDTAFYGCSKLSSVIIADGVKNIGKAAFRNCFALKKIEIPGSVKTIDDFAFYKCSSLDNIIVSAGTTSIGRGAFYSCSSLTSIIIPEGITSIEEGAFGECSSLTSIVIPAGTTSIGRGAFGWCPNLESVTIPSSVIDIGDQAFSDCSNLVVYCLGSSFFHKSYAYKYCKNNKIRVEHIKEPKP